ncbi:hypothetical protein [Nitratifractor sp.]
MKRIVVLIFVLIASLLAEWSQARCKEEAKKLLDLQNRIVTQSFERLPKGAWARYNDGTVALYLGKDKTPDGALYGIEFSGSKMPVAQVWYTIVDKQFQTPIGPATMRTLDPRLLYVLGGPGGGLMRIDGPILQLALQRIGGLSIILTPTHVKWLADCSHHTEVHPLTGYRLEGGQVIDGAKIVDYETGGSLIVSEKVPFGLVGDPSGTPHLVAYGVGGVQPHIDAKARQRASSMPPIPILGR